MGAEERSESPIAGAQTVWHTRAWAETVVAVYGFEDCSLRSAEGCLPLFLSRSPLTGRKLVSAVFNGIAGPLARDAAGREALVARAAELARARGVDWLEIKSPAPLSEAACRRLGLHVRAPYWLDVLPLSAGAPLEARVGARFRKHLRRIARRAEAEGVRVERSAALADLDAFHRLLVARNRDRFGTPAQPRSLLREVGRRFLAPGQGSLFVARGRGGEMLAGALFLHAGDVASGFLSAASETRRPLALDTLVKVEAARQLARQGVAWLDLGVASPAQPGVLAAKARFAPQRTRSCSLVLPVGRSEVPAYDYAEVWPLARALYRHVPLPLARRLPELLARYLN